MSYWSGEKLVERLPTLISPFTVENIDCNSYTLTVGEEVYVTPHHEIKDILSHTKKRLLSSESFSIPPGQFAYLITEEIVSVPSESMAFISMKSTTKFRGLINVSGFHVDPGYHGRLIFAVFNAGPSKLNLQRGQPIFLIWFCDLDRVSSEPYVKTENNQSYDQIPNSFIDNIPGQIHSIRSLHDKIEENTSDRYTQRTRKIFYSFGNRNLCFRRRHDCRLLHSVYSEASHRSLSYGVEPKS